jgi:chitinase
MGDTVRPPTNLLSKTVRYLSVALLVSTGTLAAVAQPAQAAFSGQTLKNSRSASCLQVRGGATADGTQLEIAACANVGQQKFSTTAAGEIRVTIGSVTKCLDANQGGGNGTKVILWSCHNGQSQKWTHTSANALNATKYNRCLDINAGATTAGTPAVLWDCKNGGNGSQTWVPTAPPTTQPPVGNKWLVGYFTQWGVYARNYHVKNIDTSGSASKITHILYAFANTTGGRCSNADDPFADYQKAYTADQSVDGVADAWDAPLRGSYNQLRKLKKKYPHIKVIYSVGGWTWSKGFPAAASNPAAFAQSCKAMVENPLWADVFDGIDIDWEFPQACGDAGHCDNSGVGAYKNIMAALRSEFGANYIITSAITADASNGGKMDAADYAGGIAYLDKVMPMTYDFFGGWAPQGPTAPHSPLNSYTGIPQQGFWSDAAIQKLKGKGVPASKILLGVPFYGRGWTGVTQEAPGGTASGAAAGSWEAGVADYKDLKNNKCAGAAVRTIAGTAYSLCAGGNWWGYDTAATITGKMNYGKQQGLGGAFFWEFNGDTAQGELITAMKNNL